MTKITLLTQADAMIAIEVLRTDAASVQERIHQIACSTFDHVRAHGDTTGAVALLNALPKGQRVKALAFWFSHFSGKKIVMVFVDGAWKCNLSKQRDDSDFRTQAACETSFADLTNERDPVSLTVDKLLATIKRNSTNTEKHEGSDIDKVSPEARALSADLLAYARSKGYDQKTVN